MKTSKFQIIFMGVMVLFIIGGVIAFATFKNNNSSTQLPTITIWGTFPKNVFDQYVSKINNSLSTPVNINYTQESPSAFEGDFVSALARGAGPDAILIPVDMLLPNEDKLTPIPYNVLAQRDFINAYIDEAGLYISKNGLLGLPFLVDPLVMYWNRDLFNAAGIAEPPKYWDQFQALNQKLTVKNQSGTITQSAVAMGDFTNVDNAREILGSLLMQSGNPVTAVDTYGSVSSTLSPAATADPTKALDFFTQFVNPSSANYSWNRSWPEAKTAFLAGNLGVYFGFASELADLRAKNPNLNFDVAELPQVRTGGTAATYGRLYGFSLVKASANTSAAYTVISSIIQPAFLANLVSATYLPSVSRTVIAAGSTDPYLTIFNRSALIAKAWLDVDINQSNQILGNMVQAVSSGQKSLSQAVSDAGNQYNVLLHQALPASQ